MHLLNFVYLLQFFLHRLLVLLLYQAMLLDSFSHAPIFKLDLTLMPIDLFIQLAIPCVPNPLHLLVYL